LTGSSCQWLTAALANIAADRTLSAHEKLVLVMLAHHGYGRQGECWPSVQTLAAETGLCRRKVIYVVDALTKKRRLERIRRPKPGDRHESNLYRVRVGVGAQHAPTWVHGVHPNRISTADSSLLSISESSPLPPSRGKEAAVSSFVPIEIVKLAERLFQEDRRKLVASSIRKLLREIGDEPSEDELARFLRHQAKHRNANNLGAPIAAACDPDEFERWRARDRPPPAKKSPSPRTTVKPLASSELAARAQSIARAKHHPEPRNRHPNA